MPKYHLQVRVDNVFITDLVEANVDERVGLAFVPNVLESVTNKAEGKRALVRAYELGLLELRPDGGLGRFTQAELDACPDGPQGSRLMWARLL
jgi:hypothetical protein